MPVPPPPRVSGFTIGDRNAPLALEAFLDIQCPYSAKAWPVLMDIRDAYPGADLSLTVHLTVLANHRQAWDVTRLVHAVCDRDPARFRAFATFLYGRQEDYFNGPFAERTHADLIAFCGQIAGEFDRKVEDVTAQMDSDRVSMLTRTQVRHAAQRGIWSTPTFFLNGGELVSMGSSSNLAEWRTLLDQMLDASS